MNLNQKIQGGITYAGGPHRDGRDVKCIKKRKGFYSPDFAC